MGEIRDASLRKGLRVICEPCDNRRLKSLVELQKLRGSPASKKDSIRDILDDITTIAQGKR